MKAQAATGASALSVGPGVDIAKAIETVGSKVCILGNIDPITMLLQGSVEQVRQETRRIIEIGKQNGGYIFNSGEMIPRDVPEENIRVMIDTAKEFGNY
jgi:uroporphyrinogen decarboxylase